MTSAVARDRLLVGYVIVLVLVHALLAAPGGRVPAGQRRKVCEGGAHCARSSQQRGLHGAIVTDNAITKASGEPEVAARGVGNQATRKSQPRCSSNRCPALWLWWR